MGNFTIELDCLLDLALGYLEEGDVVEQIQAVGCQPGGLFEHELNEGKFGERGLVGEVLGVELG